MTYNVFSGTLNPTHFTSLSILTLMFKRYCSVMTLLIGLPGPLWSVKMSLQRCVFSQLAGKWLLNIVVSTKCVNRHLAEIAPHH